MAGKDQTATPPAASGGITSEQLDAAIAGALKPVTETLALLSQNQKVIADTMAPATKKEEPGAGAGAGAGAGGKKEEAGAGKPLTGEDVKSIVGEALKGFTQQQQTAQQREQFIAQHLGKLPAAYQQQLGEDPIKWADEAKRVQGQFESDFKALGGKPETIGGATRDGGTAAGTLPPDLSKLSGFELLGLAMEGQKPVAPGPAGAGALTPEAVHAAAANTANAVGAGGAGGDARRQPLTSLTA